MDRIEYSDVVDKSGWPAGPWHREPDKIQWQDEATGLPCLIVRGPVGSLCGYVGVPSGHPLHGKDASTCMRQPACEESWCDHRPDSVLSVHGGVTFSDSCYETSREKWDGFRIRMLAKRDEAKRYPVGDAARALKEWAACLDDYDAFTLRAQARFVCHIPGKNEPDDVWWFGFDCSHAGDLSPEMGSLGLGRFGRDEVYRDIAYVTAQCASLAEKLKRMV